MPRTACLPFPWGAALSISLYLYLEGARGELEKLETKKDTETGPIARLTCRPQGASPLPAGGEKAAVSLQLSPQFYFFCLMDVVAEGPCPAGVPSLGKKRSVQLIAKHGPVDKALFIITGHAYVGHSGPLPVNTPGLYVPGLSQRTKILFLSVITIAGDSAPAAHTPGSRSGGGSCLISSGQTVRLLLPYLP